MGDKKGVNLEYAKELRKVVKEELQLHRLLGLAVYLGSYTARKEGTPKHYFTGYKDTSSKAYEAEHIASAQSRILNMLKDQTPQEIMGVLEKEAECTNEEGLNKSEISKALAGFRRGKAGGGYEEIGKRVETRFKNEAKKHINELKEYKRTGSDRTLQMILFKEEEIIRSSILYETRK